MDEFLTPVELGAIDDHDVLLQSGYWGRFKSQFGWRSFGFLVNGELPLLAMTRRIAPGLSLCYVPHGPLVSSRTNQNEYYLVSISKHLKSRLPAGCIFIRYDLPWGVTGAQRRPAVLARPFHRAPMDIQPPSTVVIDLTKSEDEILSGMKAKTRYNVGVARRRGVEVYEAGIDGLDRWYALYEQTAERDHITIHSKHYYRALFELAAREAGGGTLREAHLLLASAGEELLGGVIVMVNGRRATYLYGASSNEKRNYMASYLLQWQAMLLARSKGCKLYDLFGIPFDDDPGDPMHGLYRFKTGFGGTILNRPGSWDYPLSPALYAIYRSVEAARRTYYKGLRRRGG